MATPPPHPATAASPIRGLNSEELVTWSPSSMATISMATGDNSSNMTESGMGDRPIEFYREAQIGFLVVILLMIVVGNAVVLLAIALSPERRMSRMNFFIMNLALADLLNGLLSVLVDLIMKITVFWYADTYTCKIVMYTRIVVTYASTYMLVSLSLDRLGAVARPMHFGLSRTRAKVLVATTWVLSLIFSLPVPFLFYKHDRPSGPAMCFIDLGQQSNWQIYITLVATALFILPAVIISICYVIIIVIIWRSSHQLKPVTSKARLPRRTQNKVLLNGHYSGRGESCTSSRGIIPQAKIRTIKMTFVIVLVFIVCWSPYFVFNLCSVYGWVPHSPGWSKVNVFVQSLGPLNSAANPIIYGIFSTRICRFLRREGSSTHRFSKTAGWSSHKEATL